MPARGLRMPARPPTGRPAMQRRPAPRSRRGRRHRAEPSRCKSGTGGRSRPPARLEPMSAAPHPELDQLIATLEHLRAPGGCAWDREQTHASLVQYLVEETYELVEAIES